MSLTCFLPTSYFFILAFLSFIVPILQEYTDATFLLLIIFEIYDFSFRFFRNEN